ncbi:MAG: winged helix-turn-helix domain-containing protein [Candidatus Woesearchaeota archaeon]
MERVPLDQPTLKALAGETRVRILKLLDKKQMTPSDIAYELHMSLPTVGEHLKALVDAELVDKEETTRKWKYYSLTQKARMLLHPNTTTIWFVLGLFLFSAAATVISAIKFFRAGAVYGSAAPKLMARDAAEQLLAETAPAAAQAAPSASPVWLVSFGAAALILLIVLVLLLKKHGWLGKSLSNKKNI